MERVPVVVEFVVSLGWTIVQIPTAKCLRRGLGAFEREIVLPSGVDPVAMAFGLILLILSACSTFGLIFEKAFDTTIEVR